MIALAFIGQWRKVAGTQESRQEFELFAEVKVGSKTRNRELRVSFRHFEAGHVL